MQCTSSDLHVAIYSSNIEIVSECVKNKKIINSFWRGCTPISSALYLKRYNILQILVSNGANVNLCSRNNKMEPPLFAACRLRDCEALNILLRSDNLEIDQQDFFGRTALWAAARYCKADIVELLLNRGAKLNLVSNFCNKHPINGALQQNERHGKAVLQLLIRRGSFLDTVCKESPLKWTVQHIDRETFCLLVSAGCKVKCEDWLSYNKLPRAWQEDLSFCHWIDFIQKNPPSLLHLTACCIRNSLNSKWKLLQTCHVDRLQLPSTLSSLILYN